MRFIKKGFTLIELLAVIVVLAIISLIATPIVLNIINGVKSSSNERSLELYKQSVENAVAQYQLDDSSHALAGTYSATDDGKQIYLKSDTNKTPISNFNVDYNGSKVTCDKVKIWNNGKVTINNCKVNNVLIISTVLVSKSFSEDSWETISGIVEDGLASSKYDVGDTKEVDLGTYGKHNVRIANMSTPVECSTSGYSQTACGFVVEFSDVITSHNMNPSSTYNGKQYGYGWNKDGYPASSMYTFLKNDIYNALPIDLKNVIIDTTVISSHGSEDTTNFTSADKLYLLSPKEVYNTNHTYDSASSTTRQLDYYNENGVTISSYAKAIKKYNIFIATLWWLRSANSNNTRSFYGVYDSGTLDYWHAYISNGASPAFRIG